MKVTNFNRPTRASWMELNDRRLDGSAYLSGAIEARIILEALPVEKHPLHKVTRGGMEGIFNGPRFPRNYVDSLEYGIPFLGSTDILAADLSRLSLLSKEQVAKRPELLIDEGWTLITCSGTIGRMAYSRPDMKGMAGSQHFMRVVPDKSKIPPGYLYAFLSSKFGVPLIVSGTYGAIIQHIEPKHISSLPVPRIGQHLEIEVHRLVQQAADQRSMALGVLYESAPNLLRILKMRPLAPNYTYSRPLTAGINSADMGMRFEGTYHSPLAIEAENLLLQSGHTIERMGHPRVTKTVFKPSIFKRMWVGSPKYGVPFVSGNDIYRIDPTPERYVSHKSSNFEDYILKEGWVVFQGAGQLNGIFGWPLLINSLTDGMFCADDIFRIVSYSKADAGYIYAYLRTEYGQRLLKRQAYGYSIPRVVAQHVSQILIPWPAENIRAEIGRPVYEAWKALANAAQSEREAINIVETKIEQEVT